MAGEIDIGGSFLRGVAMRRQIEETREIIADRARRTEAEQKMMAMQARLQEMGASGVLSMAKVRDVAQRAQRGEATEAEVSAAWDEYSREITDFSGKSLQLTSQVIASAPGNEHLVAKVSAVSGLIQQQVAQIQDQVTAYQQMNIAEKKLELDRMATEASVEASRASAAAERGRLALAQNQDRREEGREPYVRGELQASINRSEAETNRTLQTTDFESDLHPSNLRASEANAAIGEAGARKAGTEADRAAREEARDKLSDSMTLMAQVAKFAEDAKKEGWSKDAVASKVREVGFDPDELNLLIEDYETEQQAELVKIDKNISRARQAIAEGRGTEADLAPHLRAKERIQQYKLNKEAALATYEEYKAQEGDLAAFGEKLSLMAKRRRLPMMAEVLKGGANPFASITNLYRYITENDYADVLENSNDPLTKWLGQGYSAPRRDALPSEQPSLYEQTERDVQKDPLFDPDAWEKDQSP